MSRPKPLFSLRSAKDEVTAVSFIKRSCKDKIELITGHSNGEIQLWNLETNRPEIVWSAHGSSRVKWIGTVDDRVFSFGRNNRLAIWNIASGSAVRKANLLVDCDSHCRCNISIIGSSFLLAVPQNDEKVHVADVNSLSLIRIADPGNGVPKCGMTMFVKLAQVKSTPLLFVAYESGMLAIFLVSNDLENSIMNVKSHLSLYSDPITCLDFHPETMRGIAGSVATELVTWKIDLSDFRMSIVKPITITNPGVECVAIHPAGIYVAVGGWDSRIRIFSWKSLKPLAVMDFHSGTILDMAFCQMTDSSVYFAAASKDGKVSIWDLYGGRNI